MVSLLTHICVTRPQWVNLLDHAQYDACQVSFVELLGLHIVNWVMSTVWSDSRKRDVTLSYNYLEFSIFTRGQFWPSGIVVACVRVCVCLSVRVYVNHLLVRTIIRDPFKRGSPNLVQRCKRPWTGFVEWSTLTFKRSNLTWNSKFTPFWADPWGRGCNWSGHSRLKSQNFRFHHYWKHITTT